MKRFKSFISELNESAARFTPQQIRHLHNFFRGGASEDINGKLRDGEVPDEWDDTRPTYDTLLAITKDKKNHIGKDAPELHHGLPFDSENGNSFINGNPGDVVHMKGFMSTSKNPKVAEDFSNFESGAKTKLVLHIKKGIGKSGVDLSGVSGLPEDEVLFKPGMKVKILDKSKIGDTHHVNVEVK